MYEQGLLPGYKWCVKHLNELAEQHPQLKKYIGQPTVGASRWLAGPVRGASCMCVHACAVWLRRCGEDLG